MNFDKVTECLDSFVRDKFAPGVDCIVTKNHKRIYRYFAGKRDIEKNIPIDGTERYLIFSMTKMITCACALRLLEEGKYQLDDPISEYLPEFSEVYYNAEDGTPVLSKTEITVRNLFTMTAGFNYNIQEPIIWDEAKKDGSNTRTIVGAFSKLMLDFEPGTRFQYSLCHDVLGALIEIWSGKKLRDYVDEYISKPLGMKNTFFCKYYNENVKNLAHIYKVNPYEDFDNRPMWNPYVFSDDYDCGGGGLISTTEDYSLFLDAMANDGIAENGYRVLNKETIDLMRTNQLSGILLDDFEKIQKGYGYGLGVRTHIDPSRSNSLSPVGEFGWDGAAGGYSMVDTENHIALTYFQHALSWDRETHRKLRNILYECLDNEGE